MPPAFTTAAYVSVTPRPAVLQELSCFRPSFFVFSTDANAAAVAADLVVYSHTLLIFIVVGDESTAYLSCLTSYHRCPSYTLAISHAREQQTPSVLLLFQTR